MERPIPDCYWVEHDHLLAGEYPVSWDEAGSRRKLTRLLDSGVDFFLDLTQEGEYGLNPYTHILRSLARGRGKPAVHCRMSIRDQGVPTPEKMEHILEVLDGALGDGRTVYVHCYGGIGRTGTVVGCHLVRHGKSGRDALMRIAELRQGVPDDWADSPETDAQRSMVLNWT